MREQIFLGDAPLVGFGEASVASPTDPRELPSSRSAIDLVEGKPGAIWRAGGHTLLRSALIGGGMYVIGGDRNPRLWVRALGAGVAIELFAIGWVLTHRDQVQAKQ